MKTRYSDIALATLAWALIGCTVLAMSTAARAEDRPKPRTSSRQAVKRPPKWSESTIGRLIAHSPAAPQQTEAEPARPAESTKAAEPAMPAARSGITVEKLLDRWKSGRETPKPKAAPRSKPAAKVQAAEQPETPTEPVEEQLESPQPAPEVGEFPVFRAEPQPQSRPAAAPKPIPLNVPAPIREQESTHAPAPIPNRIQAPAPAAPAELPTSVMTKFETPVPAEKQPAPVVLGFTTPSAAPAAAENRGRGASSYLTKEVRFGVVLRGPSRGKSLDPTADILGEVSKASPGASLTPVEPQSLESFEPAQPDDDSGPRPQGAPIHAEDVSRFQSIVPTASAEISGRSARLMPGDAADVASGASSAALQQALRRYGKPHGSQPAEEQGFVSDNEAPLQPVPEPQLQPQPELQPGPVEGPTPEDEASRRSVLLGGTKTLAIDRPGQPKSQGIRLNPLSRSASNSSQGSVAGVDKANRTILVRFSSGSPPAIGSKLQVSQKVLFHRHPIGEFQVVEVRGNTAVAKPTQPLDLDLVVNGDEVAAVN